MGKEGREGCLKQKSFGADKQKVFWGRLFDGWSEARTAEEERGLD